MIKRSKKAIPSNRVYTFGLLNPNNERTGEIANSPDFIEKNRKAREILKDCTLTEELIEEMFASKTRKAKERLKNCPIPEEFIKSDRKKKSP